jgi:hypothetical protein
MKSPKPKKEQPHLPINNSTVENVLRAVAVGRENWLHPGSNSGGRTAAAKDRAS